MKTTAEKIEVMQGFERGEKIEYFPVFDTTTGGWIDFVPNGDEPAWDWFHNDYRLKPKEPREYQIVLHKGGGIAGVMFLDTLYNVVAAYGTVVHNKDIVNVREILP